MSTRTQLRFVSERGNHIAQVYNHSDGYPTSIVPALEKLRNILRQTQWQRDVSYTAAQFIFVRKLSSMQRSMRDVDGDPTDTDNWDDGQTRAYFLGGHGVENPADGIHGDEEYLYEVEIPEHDRERRSEWNIRISEHCGFPDPAWEDRNGNQHGTELPEGETVFDHTDWLFDGPLTDAVDLYEEVQSESDGGYNGEMYEDALRNW